MNWLNRYIDAVKSYLPGKIRQDVGEELHSILQDKVDETEERNGSPVNDEQMMDILKSFGHPIQVAAAYQSQKVLVSENLFPLYKEVLRYTLIGLAILMLIPVTWSALQGEPFYIIRTALNIFYEYAHKSLVCIASITIVFHYLDDSINSKDYFSDWNPKSLPDTSRSWISIPLADSFFEICLTIGFLVVVNGGAPENYSFIDYENAYVHLTDVAITQLPIVNGLMGLYLILYIINVFQPYWTKIKMIINTVLGAVTLFVFTNIFAMKEIVNFVPDDREEVLISVDSINYGINLGVKWVVGFILLVTLYEVVRDIYRLVKLRTECLRIG